MKDLGKMMAACREVWEQVPQEQKDQMQEKHTAQTSGWLKVLRYDAEMEIWKPKWEEYKKTDSYKEFCLEKQERVAGLGGVAVGGVQGQEGKEEVLES